MKLCIVLVLLLAIDQVLGGRPLEHGDALDHLPAHRHLTAKKKPPTKTPKPTTKPISNVLSTSNAIKKGVGAWYTKTVQANLADLGVGWYYTWRPSTSDAGFSAPAGIEHVPMIWGAKEATPNFIDQAKAEPSPVLLGFNEPDKEDQANMSVSEAISLWPLLMETEKRLGSPATAKNPAKSGSWQDQFMKEVAAKGYKVDFMAVHYYAENVARWDTTTAVADMKAYLDAIYAKYQKPIWVTEWALTHWWPFPITYPSFGMQAAFAKAASQMMESLPYVERYAFFALPSYGSGSTSYLYNADGSITETGNAYRSV